MIAYFLAAMLAQQTPPQASPPSARPPYQVYGVGGMSCSGWTRARQRRDGVEAAASLSWLAGFITAHNSALGMLRNIDDLLGGSSMSEASAWIDAYCRRNPDQRLHYAAQELIAELIARQRAGRGRGN